MTEKRKKLEKERDRKIEKRKMSAKLEATTRAKRLDRTGWFVQMAASLPSTA